MVVRYIVRISLTIGLMSASTQIALAEPERYEPLATFRECGSCPQMVAMPSGSFVMGAPLAESASIDRTFNSRPEGERYGLRHEGPQHTVMMDRSFAIARTETTYNSWVACVAANACVHDPDQSVLDQYGRNPYVGTHPVIDVSFSDAMTYISWLNQQVGQDVYRLPTEAEWEYAARAGSQTPYAQGKILTSEMAQFFDDAQPNARVRPVPVEAMDAANRWGLRHMSGNVRELTSSCWSERHLGLPSVKDYVAAAEDARSCRRVVKGGSYNAGSSYARPAARGRSRETFRSPHMGFRVVRDLPDWSG